MGNSDEVEIGIGDIIKAILGIILMGIGLWFIGNALGFLFISPI